jgi:hypothetical protein
MLESALKSGEGGLTLRLKDINNGDGITDASMLEFYKTVGSKLAKTGRANGRPNVNPL